MRPIDTRFVVYHLLRVRGLASSDALAAMLGLPPADVEAVLDASQTAGDVAHRSGRMAGWRLSSQGSSAHAEELRELMSRPELRTPAEAAYARFLPLNQSFKEFCTGWQNERNLTDAVQRLRAVHAEANSALEPLTGVLPWYSRYVSRLQSALQRAEAGDPDAVTRPMSDSYHDVWMEIHQDLLLLLGRTRDAADGS